MGREIDIGATDGDAMQNAVTVLWARGYRADRRWCCASGDRGGGFGTGDSEEGDCWDGEPCGLHGTSGMEEAAANGSSFRLPRGAHNQYLSINTKRSRARDRTYTEFTHDVNSTSQYEIGPTGAPICLCRRRTPST